MSAEFEIILIAVLTAIACALPGVFLVLRGLAMMTDAITHTMLLGIVLAFFMTNDLSSPWLILGAALIAVVTVWLTETLTRTRLVAEDSAIGVVFPLLFSIAIILISQGSGHVHLDTDSVLLGELAFAPFDRMVVAGHDLGARGIYLALTLVALHLLFIPLFFKELKISTFDPMLGAVMGFVPALIHYGLMTLVSVTAVGAFQAVGAILVVAFMIGPPLSAYLLTHDLKRMLGLSALYAAAAGVLGFFLATALDVSIAGSMAMVTGVFFALTFLLAPERGYVASRVRRRRQKEAYAQATLLLHLVHHQDTDRAAEENGRATLGLHLHWSDQKVARQLSSLLASGDARLEGEQVVATPQGRVRAEALAASLLALG
ncbi:Manganese ABC transporter, inner membrane permease protein SitD [Clostridiaceae bacterium JG1575]|nr:Manganese ABC transporter, inner membrane permease protein SitD [Clostridiaceae bacterium JG1575]